MKTEKEIVGIIRGNLFRAYRDKYPHWAHDVAVYNDILLQIGRQYKLDIDYTNGDANIRSGQFYTT